VAPGVATRHLPQRKTRSRQRRLTTARAGDISRAKTRGYKFFIQKGMSRDDIIKKVKFEQHRDLHNCYRMNLFIKCYFHF
jgi:hypothetical protein